MHLVCRLTKMKQNDAFAQLFIPTLCSNKLKHHWKYTANSLPCFMQNNMHNSAAAAAATTNENIIQKPTMTSSSFGIGEYTDLVDPLMDLFPDLHNEAEADEEVVCLNIDRQQQQQPAPQQPALQPAPRMADISASHDSAFATVPSRVSYNLRSQQRTYPKGRSSISLGHRLQRDDEKQPPGVTSKQAPYAIYFGDDKDNKMQDYHTQSSDSDSEWYENKKQQPTVFEKGNKTVNPKKPADSRGKRRTRVRKVYEPQVRKYFEFRDIDVLCHRGGFANKHPGNMRYHQVKVTLQHLYEETEKSKKREVTQQLVDAVHAWGGRFLEQEEDTERWFEIHEKKALTKASQALRENYSPEQRAAKRARYRLKKEQEQTREDDEEEQNEEEIDEAEAVHEI